MKWHVRNDFVLRNFSSPLQLEVTGIPYPTLRIALD
jgi:hypothetical protein